MFLKDNHFIQYIHVLINSDQQYIITDAAGLSTKTIIIPT